MMKYFYKVIAELQGYTLATAESCTGGGIGAALTSVPGSSAVYKGGIISYTDSVKIDILGVNPIDIQQSGAVSESVARQMAIGVRKLLQSDYAISVTGLAGPEGDAFGNPVGTVYIGFANNQGCFVNKFLFSGDREAVRSQTINAALDILIDVVK